MTAAFDPHDHAACRATALAHAEATCARAGARLTPIRRRVLELLLEDHRALGAYAILDRLRAEGLGAQPPVAYRALDFLVRHRLAHRIEHLNAFVACAHPGRAHAPVFLICRGCSAVAEAPAAPVMAALGRAAAAAGFLVDRAMVEAEGLCPACREAAP
jgi:Fur family transcriptional regulator, zinc uptake regulator